MRKAERLTWTMLAILVLLTITAIILQIVNENTNTIETTYEIITFSVAAVALMLAITQGIFNARMSHELKKIIHENSEILKAEKAALSKEAKLEKQIKQELETTQEISKQLKKK